MIKASVAASLLAGVVLVTPMGRLQAQTPPAADEAPAAEPVGIQDIVVTAQKRSENVQSVPLAITALSGNALEQQHIASIASLVSAVPNVNFGTYGGAARIAIRGIGFDTINPGGEARVAYHLDGVYISRPAATFGTFFDVDRVEVLRGPQGTLYGRNATGGSINIITRQPTDNWQGYVRAGYGNYNAITSEGAIGGPIAQGVRFRVAFTTEDHDGWGKNVVTGHDIDNARRRGARGALSFDLGSSGKLDLSADYYHEHDRNYGNHYLGQANPAVTPSGFLFGGFVPGNVRNIANNFDPSNDRTFYGAAARVQFDLGSVTLKSISAYRHSRYFITTDLDVTSAPLTIFQFFERGRQLSQEFQLSGESGRLKYLAGLYYFDEKIVGGSAIPLDRALVGLPALLTQGYRVEGNIHTKAAAAFGQADYAVTDTLTATVGARYSWEKHHIDDYEQFDLFRPYPPVLAPSPIFTRSASSTDKAFTPKVVLQYKPRRGVMFYVSASKGFKSGGFDVGDPSPAFRPESLWAYEAGVKSTFANGLVRINASGFYYDYKNLQVSKVVNATVLIQNAASSVIYGAEAEITVIPYEGLQFDVSPAWLHSRYKDFSSANPATPANPNPVDLTGNQLTQAPSMAINAGAEYRWRMAGGHLSLRGEVNFQDRIYFTPFNEKAVSRAPNTKINAFLNYQGRRIDVSIYGRNLANRTTIANGLVSSAVVGLPVTGTLEAPRTYGIQVGYKF
jgi:iron complex outermembrane receptor protein